jgi:predicted signal transduction protein with EAL and GGDEF domain
MGDLLLRQVAQRLLGSVREGDTVARLGGDEFVVMLEDLSRDAVEAATQAETVGRKILAALDELYEIRTLSVHSTPSLGATLFGAQVENLEEPIKRADLAMYQAKNAGRNTIRFYDPRMQSLLLARADLERDLRAALQQDQFVLHYQPQVQRGGLVAGAEALLRWQHPQRGLVPPAEFIALSEETGLILPLGEHVLELACRQLALWATQPGMAHLTLSVNVSPRQFQQEQFVDQVLAVLQRTGAPPARLKLELTESLLISNVDEVIAKMDAIKARGVGFSLDDFGTGYSSLSYLKRMPLDQLKIDQGFVRDILEDPNDAAIARMVIVLGESLGLEVMAEGVETLAQQQALQALGCHAYQGYLYSKPLTVEALAELARQTGWPIMTLRG